MLQVSKDNFTTFLTGFDGKILTTNSIAVPGLEEGKAYQYRVKRFRNGFSSDFSEPVVATLVTGLEDFDHTISFYPNPVVDILRVHVTNQSNRVKFTLRSLTGSIMIEQPIDKADTDFDMRSYATGMYIATVDCGAVRKNYKIVYGRSPGY